MASFAVLFRSVVALADRYPVLAGVDLTVERGERILVTGANGAGKTSLLRVIAGLLPITEGNATVLDCDLFDDRRALRRAVGYLGHAASLYGELTVRENVAFAVRAAGGSVAAVDDALTAFQLDGRLADVPLHRVSAGQRRRTSLACLVGRDPELWLLDEPHSGLDGDTRVLLNRRIKQATEEGKTVIFTSHEQHESTLHTRAVEISGGTVRTVGTQGAVHVS